MKERDQLFYDAFAPHDDFYIYPTREPLYPKPVPISTGERPYVNLNGKNFAQKLLPAFVVHCRRERRLWFLFSAHADDTGRGAGEDGRGG